MTDEDLIHAPAEPALSHSGQQSSVPTGKTMGQLAKEAYGAEFHKSKSWEAVADVVIELCALAIAGLPPKRGSTQLQMSAWAEGMNDARIQHADFLRSLKSNPKGEDHDAG